MSKKRRQYSELNAGVFEALVRGLRMVLRLAEWCGAEPSAAIFDSRTLQSTPEGGQWAGYDAAKRKRGSKVPYVGGYSRSFVGLACRGG